MRAAKFYVSTKLLEQVLNLPAGARIIGATKESPIDGMVELVVDDPMLPEADEPHECYPTATRIEWNWNIEEESEVSV